MKVVDPHWLLEELGIEFDDRRTMLWGRCPHPDHNDGSPSWRVIADETSDRYGQHRCYGCGYGGYAVHLVETVLNVSREEARAWLELRGNSGELPAEVDLQVRHQPLGNSPRLQLPDGVVLPGDRPIREWPIAVKRFLHGRGVTVDQVTRWGIGYAETGVQRNRVVIPIRDHRGGLLSYTGRTFTNAPLRYKDPKLEDGADLAAVFGVEHFGAADQVVVVTEGAFNALAVERVVPSSWRVAALYGSQLNPRHLLRLMRFKTVLLATDPDNAGNRISAQLQEELGGQSGVARVVLPHKQDCNDMPPAELWCAVESAFGKVGAVAPSRAVV